MHQHIETPEQARERVWLEWDAYFDGWTDAEKGEGCSPPTQPHRHRVLYIQAWVIKRADMLKGG